MGFIDEVKSESRNTGHKCRTCQLLGQLEPDDAAEIAAVMADKNIQTEPIVRALNNRGIDIGSNSVRKHRLRCVVS